MNAAVEAVPQSCITCRKRGQRHKRGSLFRWCRAKLLGDGPEPFWNEPDAPTRGATFIVVHEHKHGADCKAHEKRTART